MIPGASTKIFEEQVLVVAVDWLQTLALRPGFDPEPERLLAALRPEVVQALPRAQAEEDPRYKQLVCYVIFQRGEAIFHYRRSTTVGEQRLAGRRSLGLGGHLNAGDAGTQFSHAAFTRAIERELAEEIDLEVVPPVHFRGIIDENTSPVSRVHLGIVATASIGPGPLTLRDASLIDGRFDRPADLLTQLDEFEGWSRRCLEGLLTTPPGSSSESRQSPDRW